MVDLSGFKTAFRVLEFFCLIICFSFVSIAFSCLCFRGDVSCFLFVWYFLYLSFLINQLWSTIVCLLPRIPLVISVKMMIAKSVFYFVKG